MNDRPFSTWRVVVLLSALAVGGFALACRDTTQAVAPSLRPSSRSHYDLSDGAHGGTPHFYFLPPMVALPHASGTGVTVSPSVELCALDNGVCTAGPFATYTTTTGPGGVTVSSDGNGNYIVNWHTGAFPLDLTKTYRITVKVLSTELGHCDVLLVDNGSEAKNAATGGDIVLVDGRTLPIKFRIEQGAVAIVGASGGTTTLDDGAVTLVFPGGAVSAPIAVTATPAAAGSSAAPDRSVIAGTQYVFQPSPTSFVAPISLTLSYPAIPARIRTPRLSVCHVVGAACIPQMRNAVDALHHTVTAGISSFSSYGVTSFPQMLYQIMVPTDGNPEAWYLHTDTAEVPIPIGPSFGGVTLDWAPDGSQLAYAVQPPGELGWFNRELHVVKADGSGDRLLVTGGQCPHWSADGTTILFDYGAQPAVINPDGTGLHVFNDASFLGYFDTDWCAERWTPDGRQITFRAFYYPNGDRLSNGAGTPGGIWMMNIDGSNKHQLIATSHYGDFEWSADGTQLAFSGNWANDLSGNGLYVVNADGSGAHLLPTWPPDTWAWSTISGDNRIAFIVGSPYSYYFPMPLGVPGVFTIRSDGSNLVTLLSGFSPGNAPANISWSPDGTRLSVEWENGPIPLDDPSNSQRTTYLLNPDGSGLQLLLGTARHGVNAVWRP